jgi:hypothetical protein
LIIFIKFFLIAAQHSILIPRFLETLFNKRSSSIHLIYLLFFRPQLISQCSLFIFIVTRSLLVGLFGLLISLVLFNLLILRLYQLLLLFFDDRSILLVFMISSRLLLLNLNLILIEFNELRILQNLVSDLTFFIHWSVSLFWFTFILALHWNRGVSVSLVLLEELRLSSQLNAAFDILSLAAIQLVEIKRTISKLILIVSLVESSLLGSIEYWWTR